MVTSPNRSSCGAWNGPAFRRFAKKPIHISNIQIFVPVNLGPYSEYFVFAKCPTLPQSAPSRQQRSSRRDRSISQSTPWLLALGSLQYGTFVSVLSRSLFSTRSHLPTYIFFVWVWVFYCQCSFGLFDCVTINSLLPNSSWSVVKCDRLVTSSLG